MGAMQLPDAKHKCFIGELMTTSHASSLYVDDVRYKCVTFNDFIQQIAGMDVSLLNIILAFYIETKLKIYSCVIKYSIL